MRTKEPKAYPTNYAEVSRKSIKRDFKNASFQRQGHQPKPSQDRRPESNVKRVLSINDTSGYAKYKRFFIGKLVRIIRPAQCGGNYVEFVRDADARILNENAGWANKREYLLDGALYD